MKLIYEFPRTRHSRPINFKYIFEGTEVAKEASDIIILDDNFSSIVMTVKWGRSVFDNIRKFVQFQLTINMVALFLSLVEGIRGHEIPITAVQLLWLNLIMGTFSFN